MKEIQWILVKRGHKKFSVDPTCTDHVRLNIISMDSSTFQCRSVSIKTKNTNTFTYMYYFDFMVWFLLIVYCRTLKRMLCLSNIISLVGHYTTLVGCFYWVRTNMTVSFLFYYVCEQIFIPAIFVWRRKLKLYYTFYRKYTCTLSDDNSGYHLLSKE